MCAVFSEFEWSTTSDRIKAGIERARKEGKRIGRPTSVSSGSICDSFLSAPSEN